MHTRHNEKSGRSLAEHVRAETKQILIAIAMLRSDCGGNDDGDLHGDGIAMVVGRATTALMPIANVIWQHLEILTGSRFGGWPGQAPGART